MTNDDDEVHLAVVVVISISKLDGLQCIRRHTAV